MFAVRPGEVHLHLVRGTGQRRDRGEGLPGEVGQPVDQRRKLVDGDGLHAAFGLRDRRQVARPQVLAPFPLEDRDAVADRRRDHTRDATRRAHEMAEDARQAACERGRGEPVDRVEIPAVHHDVVGPRGALPDPAVQEEVQPVLHRRQEPGLEERRHRLGDPLAETKLAGEGAGCGRFPGDVGRRGGHRSVAEDPAYDPSRSSIVASEGPCSAWSRSATASAPRMTRRTLPPATLRTSSSV